ncbi:SPW repeat protein [Paenarthrobacter sp. DKR-5]|uniref:SPW repeat domain-containing protein n=1 Tax=Paenarthrobacter sp. DKR-5 TaxID=2835535 RepID=UPI001BDCDF8E|nr:SPW repeat protein [Paenarthrobacter sp. DKR-5]MBT1002011.1 SPW repeat protein [Paenarthrobacter sp. DKR-5]
MKKWTRWQDWIAAAAGLYTVLAVLWTTHAGLSMALMLVFGALLIIGGLVNLAMPGTPTVEWAQAVAGALLFLAPWAGSYASYPGPAWTSWIAGAIAAIVTATAIRPSMDEHHRIMPSH